MAMSQPSHVVRRSPVQLTIFSICSSSVVLKAIASRGFCYETLVRFYAETCWVHCYTKSLTIDYIRPMDAKFIGATGRMRVSRPHLTHYNSYILHADNIRQ